MAAAAPGHQQVPGGEQAEREGHEMVDNYELVLHDGSKQPDLAFLVYAVPGLESGVAGFSFRGGYPIAWFQQGVNPGAIVHVQWTASYALMCARQPCRVGDLWQAGATEQDVEPGRAYLLDYTNGDYCFKHATPSGDLPPTAIDLYTSGNVPGFDTGRGPSVALGIPIGRQPAPVPVLAANSGPNLTHRFRLPPVYRIWAGQDVQGEMLGAATVEQHQEVRFDRETSTDPWRAEWTLDSSNQWREGPPS